jgi:integrase
VENPWERLPGRLKGKRADPIEPFSQAEVRKIIAGFEASYPHYAPFIRFAFGTGAKTGEIVALRWRSVGSDFVRIEESQTGQFHRDTTKTGRSRRVLLSPSLATMLADRRATMQPDPDSLVFPSKDGKQIHHQDHRYRWGKVLEKTGVTYRKPYATRHTAISHALENGAQPVDVAAQTGHSVAVLLQVYSHVIDPKRVFVEF